MAAKGCTDYISALKKQSAAQPLYSKKKQQQPKTFFSAANNHALKAAMRKRFIYLSTHTDRGGPCGKSAKISTQT